MTAWHMAEGNIKLMPKSTLCWQEWTKILRLWIRAAESIRQHSSGFSFGLWCVACQIISQSVRTVVALESGSVAASWKSLAMWLLLRSHWGRQGTTLLHVCVCVCVCTHMCAFSRQWGRGVLENGEHWECTYSPLTHTCKGAPPLFSLS